MRLAKFSSAALTILISVIPIGAPPAQPPNLMERLYVANEGEGTITAIDTTTHQVIATIPVGKRPHHLAITPDGRYVFVGTAGEPFMPVVDAVALKVVKEIPVVDGPAHPAISRNGKWVGVDNSASHHVSLIGVDCLCNLANLEATKGKRNKFEHPVWTPGDRYLLAGNIGGETIVQVDPLEKKIIQEYFSRGSHYIALHPDGRRAFATNETTRDGQKAVTVIDYIERRAWYIDLPVDPKRPADLHHGALTADGKFFYAADRGYFNNTNEVYIIDTETYQVVKVIREGRSPNHPLLSPDGRHMYVAGRRQDSLLKIDVKTHEVVGRLPTAGPQGIKNPYQEHLIFHPNGRYLYVVNAGDRYVAAIDVATEKVVATMPVGKRPHWIGMPGDPEKQW